MRVAVGNRRYMEEVEGLSLSPHTPLSTKEEGGNTSTTNNTATPLAATAALEKEGKTVVYVSVGKSGVVGVLAVADRPRPEAKDTVAALQRMGVEVSKGPVCVCL